MSPEFSFKILPAHGRLSHKNSYKIPHFIMSQRRNQKDIMEEIPRLNLTQIQTKQINACRVYFQITFLSDIVYPKIIFSSESNQTFLIQYLTDTSNRIYLHLHIIFRTKQ